VTTVDKEEKVGVHLTSEEGKVALFDSVTGWAFGPVFDNNTDAENFTSYAELRLQKELRSVSNSQLEEVYATWLMTMEGS